MMDREISPPPLKRQRIVADEGTKKNSAEGQPVGPELHVDKTGFRCIRVFSWNINGIQSFLPASNALITSFFQPVGERGPACDGSNDGDSEASSSPLRAFLKRHDWPEVLFLQELKTSPPDKKTPTALLCALNTPLDSHDTLTAETRYTLDVNLPRDKFNARGFGGKLYGVGTILRQDFAARYVANVRHAGWDLEGRVTIVELRSHSQSQQPQAQLSPRSSGSQRQDEDEDEIEDEERVSLTTTVIPARSVETSSPANQENTNYHARSVGGGSGGGSGGGGGSSGTTKPLALLNIYAVNGTGAPYRSPTTGQDAGTRHDHKLAFHARLRDECLDLERRRGFEVVVAGDLNVARGPLDGWPNLRTVPRQHCLNRADFNVKFFGGEENKMAGAYVGEGEGEGKGEGECARVADIVGSHFDGVDVFRALRGKERRFTYHPRGGDD